MSKTVIGIIGAGFWGDKLVRNFSALDDCVIKYVCDLDEARLADIKQAYLQIAQTTKDVNSVFGDPEVAGVVVATPADSHYALAKKALLSGKHVLIEKPMTSSSKECQELIDIAKQKGLVILIDHTFLYAPAIQYLRTIIENGEMGELYYFTAERFNPRTAPPDVNVIWDLAAHNIAIMRYLFAPAKPKAVLANGGRYINEGALEIGHVFIHFDNGAVGHIQVNWLSPFKSNHFVVGGSKKMVLFDNNPPRDKLKIYDIENKTDKAGNFVWPIYTSPKEPIAPVLAGEEALKREAAHFLACIGGQAQPLVAGEDGLAVVRIMEACDESLKTGKIVNL